MTPEKRIKELEIENRKLRNELEKYRKEGAGSEGSAGSAGAGSDIAGSPLISGEIEDALRTSELKFEISFNTSPGLMFISRFEDGAYTRVNDSWCSLTGYSRGELIGHSSVELGLVSEESRKKMIRKMNTDGSINQYELQITAKNGEIKDIIISTGVIKISGDRQILSSGIDLTSRKKAEADLTRAHNLLKSITSGTDDMIAAHDRDLNFIFFNETYAREFRRLWAKDIETGTNLVEAMAPWPEEQKKAKDLLSRTLKGETFNTISEFGPPEDKQFYDLQFNPLLDTNGRIFGAVQILRNVTEQVNTQKALHESESQFRQLAESMPQLVWVARPDGRHEYFNSRWNEFTASFPGKAHGEYWPGILHPEDLPRALERWSNCLETGDPYSFEFRLKKGSDGTYHWFLARAMPVKNDQGEIARWLGTCTYIQEQKEALEALRESQDLLQNVLEVLPVGVFVADENGKIDQTNSAAEKIWGGSRHVPIDRFNEYRGWWKDTDVRIEAGDWAFARAFSRGETSVNEEIDIECFDGTRKTILNSATPVRNDRGEIISAVAVVMDVTDRVRAETALRESEERFRTLADNMSQLAWMADGEGGRFWYNKRWFDYTGSSQEEMHGWGWKNIIHPDHSGRVIEKMHESWNTGEMWEDIFPLRGKEGQYRWFLSRAVPIKDKNDNIIRWFGTNTDITEQRESEEEAKKSNAVLEAFFESSPGILNILDEDLRYLKTDNTTPGFYGLERDELTGKTIHDVSPESVGLYKQMLENVTARKNASFSLEIKTPLRDGQKENAILKTSYFSVPLRGNTSGMGMVGIDVTDLRKTQELLKHERELLQTIIDGIPVMITIFTSDIREIQPNRAFENITGWTGEDTIGRHIMELIFPDPVYRKEAELYMSSLETGFRDIVMTTKDGRTIETTWANVRLHDERHIGIGIDISERKIMERQLREQALMLDQVQDAIIALDDRGSIKYMNDAAFRMYEVDRDSGVIGTSIWDHYLIHWDDMSSEESMIKKLNDAVTWKGENIHVSAKGNELWVDSVVSAIKDPDGNITGFISAMRDITERKKLQKKLHTSMEEQRKAGELFENLLYIAAHDLKGPIANMYLALNLIDRIGDTDKKIMTLGMFRPLVSRLENTIKGLTSILQVQKNDKPVARRVYFESIINEILLDHRETLYEGTIQYDFTEKPFIVYIEPFLSSIMKNLVNNSINYSRDNVPLKINISSKEQHGDCVLLMISDNGMGIDLEKHGAQLFTPFKRFTPEKAEGTGVGLYIVKSITEKNGGHVEVKSVPGEGTTFYCYLREYKV
jgi:PAS domain S-box-containing protein